MAHPTRVILLLAIVTSGGVAGACVRREAATSAPTGLEVNAVSRLDASAALAETAEALEPEAKAPARTYASLTEACQDPHLVDLTPPGSCHVDAASGATELALLRITAREETHVRLAVRAQGGWRVGACKAMIDTSVSSLHNVVDDVRDMVLDDRGAAVLRYVRHVQDLEPQGVGAGGNGDSSKVRESSVYEDHLVHVDLDAGTCADTTVFADPQRERVIEFVRVRGRHVPRSWRASLHVVGDPFWGFRLAERSAAF